MNKVKEFLEELKHNKKVNIEKGLENRVDIDYVIERLEDVKQDLNIINMYRLVFEDCVRGYAEEYNDYNGNGDKVELSNEEVKEIANKVIYNNDYLWGIINETIDMYIANTLLKREEKENE